jgi:hypothetical protein
MKKIFLIILSFALTFSLYANENDKSLISNPSSLEEDECTDPIDLLIERINNIEKLKPEDFFINFKSKPLAPDFLDNTTQYGASDFFTTDQSNTLKAKLSTFNNNSSNGVKIFVVSGSYFLGYRRGDNILNSSPTQEEQANGEKILSAMVDKVLTLTKSKKKFLDEWITTYNKKTNNIALSNNKVIIFFCIEGIFSENPTNQSHYNLTESNDFALVDNVSKFAIDRGIILTNSGLTTLEWMKMNQLSLKSFVETTIGASNPTGYVDGAKIILAVDKIIATWGAPLDLSKLKPLVEAVNGLSDQDVGRIPIVDRKKYITTIAKHQTIQLPVGTSAQTLPIWISENDIPNSPVFGSVFPIEGKKALNKMLLNAPSNDSDAILDFLETELIGSNKYIVEFVNYQNVSSAEDDANYLQFVRAIKDLTLNSTTQKSKHLKTSTLFAHPIIYNDGSLLGVLTTNNFVGKKTFLNFKIGSDASISYEYYYTLSKLNTAPNSNASSGAVNSEYTLYSSENTYVTNIHPYDILLCIDNYSNNTNENIFKFPDLTKLTTQFEEFKGVKTINAIEFKYILDSEKYRTFKQVEDISINAIVIATGVGGVVSGIRNLRWLYVAGDFLIATGSVAHLAKNYGGITNPNIRAALSAYETISLPLSLTATGLGVLRDYASLKAFQTAMSEVTAGLSKQGNTFKGLDEAQATLLRALNKKIQADVKKGLITSADELKAAQAFLVVDAYLAKLGIKVDDILRSGNGLDDILANSETILGLNGASRAANPNTPTGGLNFYSDGSSFTEKGVKTVYNNAPVVVPTTRNGLSVNVLTDLKNSGGETLLAEASFPTATKQTLVDEINYFEVEGTTIAGLDPATIANALKAKLIKITVPKVGEGLVLDFGVLSARKPFLILAQKVLTDAVVKEIEEKKKKDECTVCKANDNTTVCEQAKLLSTKTGKTSEIETICTKMGKNANPRLANIYLKLNSTTFTAAEASQFLIDAAMTAPPTDPDHLANVSQLKLLTDLQMDSWQNLYSTHKGTTKAKYARVDTKALTKWKFLNSTAKDNITNFSDNAPSGTTLPTLKKFTGYLDANDQGTENDNFNLFMNANPDVTEAFVGHKLLAEGRDIPFYTTFYDFFQEKISQLPLQSNVYEKAKEWLDYSEESAKRGSYFKQGKDFEEWIGEELKNKNSDVYLALRNKLGMNPDGVTYDLDQRSIYTQVRFCISGNVPCDQKNQYFIADFVLAKTIKVGPNDVVDIIIADTKLSMNTDFTDNQKLAQLPLHPDYNIWTNKPPIKGSSVNGFSTRQNVVRNASFFPFFKIYRGNAPRILGGIIP